KVEEARLTAVILAQEKAPPARLADGERVERNRPLRETRQVLAEQLEVRGQRLVAVEPAARPSTDPPASERSDVRTDVDDHRPGVLIGEIVFTPQHFLDVRQHRRRTDHAQPPFEIGCWPAAPGGRLGAGRAGALRTYQCVPPAAG